MTIVPLYDVVVLPHTTLFLRTDRFQQASGRDPVASDRVVFLIAKGDQDAKTYGADSFYPVGVTGTIREVAPGGYVVVHTWDRIEVESVTFSSDHTISEVASHALSDVEDEDPIEAGRKLQILKDQMTKMTGSFQWGQAAQAYISRWQSLSEMACSLSPWLTCGARDKYRMLETSSTKERSSLIEKALYEYIEAAKVNTEAATAQAEDNQKQYREAAIKKQIEYLQKELDGMHPENISDVRKFEKKIQESGMNDSARKEAEKVLNRMKQEGNNSAEYGMLYDYLDFVTNLSWKHEEPMQIDLNEARSVLDEDHFGLKKVKERILQQIAVMDLKKSQSGSILLFVGAPGTGKTSIGQSIARALKRKYVRVSLGGSRDEADIRGHRRTYIGAMPGRIMDGIQKSGVSNPVMVLDEVDKLGSSYNGDPASALLEVLDPEQNSTFTDHYMNVPYDLSQVLFICTANSVDTIPEPLLNRMEVIQFPGYTSSDKFQIAKRHLIPKAMEAMGIKPENLEITDDAVRSVINDYTMESGVRGLKKRFDTLCRAAAVNLVKGGSGKIVVGPDDLSTYLDMQPVHHDHVLEKKKAGIVTGLAWTAAGGEILFIESALTLGSGKVTITGQLGDVMKESVAIALTLVKEMFPSKVSMLRKHDLHVHVPEGAVKKDGPSAGITLTTALSSLVTGKAVDPSFAMTGEVSLRGEVMPIGGLPEKLMAAVRSGIKTVFIPKENVRDLKDVPDEAKDNLKIVPVEKVTDVLLATGIISSPDELFKEPKPRKKEKARA